MKQIEVLTRMTHVNSWESAVYMSYMSKNVRLFHVSNLVQETLVIGFICSSVACFLRMLITEAFLILHFYFLSASTK